MDSQFFVQKYQLNLRKREELRRELEHTLQIAEERARMAAAPEASDA